MSSTPEAEAPSVADPAEHRPEPGDHPVTEETTAEEIEASPELLAAHDIALAALREITPDATIGQPAGYALEDGGVVSLRFENRLGGYPGWHWTVSLAQVAGSAPTVLEVELLPGDGALLAPEWVPWAVRLAEYRAQQEAAAAADAEDEDAQDVEPEAVEGDLDDLDDLDAADFDEDGSPLLHSGDVDGVDIDELDEDTDGLDDEESDGEEPEADEPEAHDEELGDAADDLDTDDVDR